LRSEKLTGQAIDTSQRSYAVFKVLESGVDGCQHTALKIKGIGYGVNIWCKNLIEFSVKKINRLQVKAEKTKEHL